MAFVFDQGAAQALQACAQRCDNLLRKEEGERNAAVENALPDFSGPYETLFRLKLWAESADRIRLAREFDNLATQVGEALTQASQEQERHDKLEQWTIRARLREQGCPVLPFPGAFGIGGVLPGELKPSDTPLPAPRIDVHFAPQERPRGPLNSQPAQQVSADPDRLRVFCTYTMNAIMRLGQLFDEYDRCWLDFYARCSWVRMDRNTLLSGATQLLEENRNDQHWVEAVATAFDNAGAGGTLTVGALNVACSSTPTISDDELLSAATALSAEEFFAVLAARPAWRAQFSRLDPAKAHTWWATLDPPAGSGEKLSEQQRALLTTIPDIFGNLEGLPYQARAIANRVALDRAIAASMAELHDPEGTEAERDEARKELLALDSIHDSLENDDGEQPRFLISFIHDRPPLAAVSLGDLDTATSVTFAVPGMANSTEKMTEWTNTSQNLSNRLPSTSAVVAWMGYHTPNEYNDNILNGVEVADLNLALPGGQHLARTLTGITAARSGHLPALSVLAHSYGSTTAAIALRQSGVHVKNFITLGSAGLPDSVTSAKDLNVDHVYSGNAQDTSMLAGTPPGDQYAYKGRDLSFDHHVNPMDSYFGAQNFGVDTGGDTGRKVTDHATHVSDDGPDAGYLDRNTESIENVRRILTGTPETITPYVDMSVPPASFFRHKPASSE